MGLIQPTAILTRPAGRNTSVMHGLLRRGWRVEECPALEIREIVESQAPRPECFDLIIFVSRAAVAGYQHQLRLDSSYAWPSGTLAACMGPATASAIRRTFGEAVPILHPEPDLSQDSEALWPLLTALNPIPGRVLIVRGQDGREWLSQRLRERQISVTVHQAYSRQVVRWPQSLCDKFFQFQAQSVSPAWLLTSPHGVEAIVKNIESLGLMDWFAGGRFVLTHERLNPLLVKLLNRPPERLTSIVANPEDDVILAAFEKLFLPNSDAPGR